MINVGIDFGTSNTKIAYARDQTIPQLFRYPGENGFENIATAIAYSKLSNDIFLGKRAIEKSSNPHTEFYNNFKMRLPMQAEDMQRGDGWHGSKQPGTVTRDYFLNLLESDSHSFLVDVGKIDHAVVSIPDLWYQNPQNAGPETLLKILTGLGLNIEMLQSEPVCAAAAYVCQTTPTKRYQYPFNILICDVGGGTFDAALCRVKPSVIEVVCQAGSGDQGLDAAGVAFDIRCVTDAYQRLHAGKEIDRTSFEFIRLMDLFEQEKINNKQLVASYIEKYRTKPDLANRKAYEFFNLKDSTNQSGDTYEISMNQAYLAFQPIKDGIVSVLARLIQTSEQNHLKVDKVLIVGGFGQFPLVEDTIRQYFKDRLQPDFVENSEFSIRNRHYAIAFGALYLAEKRIEVIEPYPHTLGICTTQRVDGIRREVYFPVIESRKAKASMLRPSFALDKNGNRKLVHVEENGIGKLPIYIQKNGDGEIYRPSTNQPQQDTLPPGDYYVGFQIDRSKVVTLIFENSKTGVRKEFGLGQIGLELSEA